MTAPANAAGIRELEAFAIEKGAYRAKAFSARLIVVDERVRLKCQIPLCPHYGKSLTCPPNVPTVEEFGRALALYKKAILIQTATPLKGGKDDYDKDEVRRLIASPGKVTGTAKEGEDIETSDFRSVKADAIMLHKLVNEVEGKAMALGFPYALGLIGGDCMLCPECVGVASGKSCRRPYESRPSLEGVGIDVIKTCAKAGLPFAVPPKDEIIWSGLVLLD